MIEELKEHQEVYTRELISHSSTVSTLVIRYKNGKAYMINFKAKDDNGPGWTIEDGSECPLESFILLMEEYFREKAKPNIVEVSNFLHQHPDLEAKLNIGPDHVIVDADDWKVAKTLIITDRHGKV
jgi:hypothetical protein